MKKEKKKNATVSTVCRIDKKNNFTVMSNQHLYPAMLIFICHKKNAAYSNSEIKVQSTVLFNIAIYAGK